MAHDPSDERVKANLAKKKPKAHGSCGCNSEAWAVDDEDADGEFAALLEVEPEAEADLTPDPRGTTVRRWSGLIAPYGLPTGDGRRFATGALSSRDLPLGVKWQRTDSQGHSTSVVVGRVDGIDYADGGVNAWGIIFDPDAVKLPRLAEDANEAYELLKQRVIGPSVDLDDMEFHPLGDPGEMSADARPEIEVTRGRISAITLVQIPAFAEARPFALDDLDADEYAELTSGLTASAVAVGMSGLPVADVEWDPLSLMLLDEDALDALSLYSSPAGGLFPVASIVDGALSLVPGAVADAVSVMAFHGAAIDLPEGSKQVLRQELAGLAAACGLPVPPWVQEEALTASAGAATAPDAALFADPKLSGPTPLRVEQRDGHLRVYGHLATWGVCHIGFPGACVTAPKSKASYAYFHTGSVETAAGRLPTGKITLGGGHADVRQGFQAAVEHYDETGTAVADVRAGEDVHGIWVSGVVRPGLEPKKLAELASSPLSGDWRRVGGGMELVAALAVNTPGFPVLHVQQRNGQEFALVAAAVVPNPFEVDAMAAGLRPQDLLEHDLAQTAAARQAAATFGAETLELDRLDARESAIQAARQFA